ncbi:MAG TPA: ISNCY family transposase [Ignavibacteriaceae bacterium]|nr:ISNCY family transposase [Ignavibacteriaceae bacterium]
MEGILTMSQKEIDRLQIIKKIEGKEIKVEEGAQIIGISSRQTYRVLKRVKEEGSRGIIHKLRGKKSNRGYPEELKKKVIEIYRSNYDDYGPSLFSEQLIENHNISVDHETIRRWLRSKAITTSMRKKRPHRKKRERRSRCGELLQFDGSHHDWFEGRGAECCLLNCVDDSTGKVYLKFAISENTQDVLLTLWEYVNKHGIPRSIYTDRYKIYKAEGKLTDFGRAMKELNVETIYAYSPQAKGRVERVNRTLQDRLIKALRREGISNIAEANKYAQKDFIKEYNSRFAVNMEVPDVHRKADGYDLRNIFCYKTSRKVRNDYTINLSGGYIQLLNGTAPLPRPGQAVIISRWLNGRLHIYFNSQEIKYTYLTEKPGKKGYKITKPAKDHPWRKMNQRISADKQRNFFRAALG